MLKELINQALRRRKPLLEKLHAEGTNANRLFHGISEGQPGLTIDRYGPLILLQTFREPLTPDELGAIQVFLNNQLPVAPLFSYNHRGNHRGKIPNQSFEEWYRPSPAALSEVECMEFGIRYLVCARHQGIDPWLFLDLRAGRRVLHKLSKNMSVLNLFSYTCSAGVCAAVSGASEVLNVDFAASSLEIGRKNATLNQPCFRQECFRTLQEDCFAVMRQLAGLPIGLRGNKKREFQRLVPRHFDLVFLDPPAWSKGPFGAVDVVGDYPSLFKPAVLIAKPGGGKVIATNHVASVDADGWVNVLKKCAEKAGRPIRSIEIIKPEDDFPSFDGRHPLKIALCEV